MNKKLIASILVASVAILTTPAKANADVVGALIIGGLIGHAIGDNDSKHPTHRPDVHMYPGTHAHPIYVPSPVYTPPRTWSPNPVYELLPVYDSSCNCHVMMPVRIR